MHTRPQSRIPDDLPDPSLVLTQREREVLHHLIEGCTNRDMADRMQITVKTVEKHRQHLMYKLGVTTLAGLFRVIIKYGLLDTDTRVTPTGSGMLTRIGECVTPGMAQGIAVYGRHVYLGSGSGGLQIIDVGTPTKPHVVGTCRTDGDALGLTVLGHRVYLADRAGGVKIIDVTNPTRPALIGQYLQQQSTDERWAVDVAVHGGFAYIAHDFQGPPIASGR